MVNNSKFQRPLRTTVIALLLWVVIASGCTSGAQPGPVTTASAPTAGADLDTAIEAYVTAGSGNLENITAILVSVDGKLLTEKYRQRGSAEQQTHVFSITKSVLSTLVGIAVAEGKITDLDQPLRSLLPRHAKHMSAQGRGHHPASTPDDDVRNARARTRPVHQIQPSASSLNCRWRQTREPPSSTPTPAQNSWQPYSPKP